VSDTEWNSTFIHPKDRVTLGIVDVYKRGDNYVKIEAPQKTYSSVDYLTKVFSVKANGNVGLEQFTDE
jgi:hypothetical protein